MNTPGNAPLPDCTLQSQEVKERIAKIKSRPVVVETLDLIKDFPSDEGMRRVLDRVSFQVHKREFLSVIGPSGCGKSTLIRMIACLEDITDGAVLVDNKEVTEPGADRGMVFQKYTLFPWLTVKQNVMFGLVTAGKGKFDAEREALQWLDIVGLEEYADLFPAQLSGGMQQRVAIARALAGKPKVLLMDEPFGALDAQTRAKMQAYLLQIREKIDITIIFITHDLDEAVYLSDRVLVLQANPGKIQEMVEIPVERPRGPEQFLTPQFLSAKAHLEELIHPPAEPVHDDFNVITMVAVS